MQQITGKTATDLILCIFNKFNSCSLQNVYPDLQKVCLLKA